MTDGLYSAQEGTSGDYTAKDTVRYAEKYALESMDSGVLIVDRTGSIVFANGAAREIFLVPEDPKIKYRDLFFMEDGSNDAMIDLVTDAIFSPGKKQQQLIHYTNGGGTGYALRFSCTALKGGSSMYVLTFSDETDLEASRIKYRDSTLILSILLAIAGIWSVIVACWEFSGRPIDAINLTTWIEIIGVGMLVIFLRFSSLTIKDMGLVPPDWKKTLRCTIIRIAALWGLFAGVKLIVMNVSPGFFPAGAPFWDWSQTQNSVSYIGTSLLQEFLARGGCQEALMRILPGKHKDMIAILLTSLFFMALHIQRGLIFMLGAGVLSFILGIMYKRDKNIYGISAVHYAFGKFADFFLFVH